MGGKHGSGREFHKREVREEKVLVSIFINKQNYIKKNQKNEAESLYKDSVAQLVKALSR